jgi:hypothetical protein
MHTGFSVVMRHTHMAPDLTYFTWQQQQQQQQQQQEEE